MRPDGALARWALAWEGCVNVRDLGGLPLDGGGRTRFGAVVRADSVRGLTRAGWEALEGYGVRTIVDLRWHEELAEDPPDVGRLQAMHVSLFGEFDPVYGREVDDLGAAQPTPAAATREAYLALLRRYRDNVARAVAVVADAGEGGVVVHCAAGKDRTGLVVALVLRLAGVPSEAVAADYALSEANWAPHIGAWIEAADTSRERARRRRLAVCPPEAMVGVLEALELEHGSIEAFLLAGGASEEQIARAAARLRG